MSIGGGGGGRGRREVQGPWPLQSLPQPSLKSSRWRFLRLTRLTLLAQEGLMLGSPRRPTTLTSSPTPTVLTAHQDL